MSLLHKPIMRTFLVLLLPLVLTVSQIFAAPCGGVERWAVKVLTDAGVNQINFVPKTATVSDLVAMNVKKVGMHTARMTVECQVYRVKCKILRLHDEDDGDYHLVIAEPSNTSVTMIAEIPDPTCSKVYNSPYVNKFKIARNAFEGYCDPQDHEKVVAGTYQLTGVLFVDRLHSQDGLAPNGIELHPILTIKRVED